MHLSNGRGSGIRTHDILLPKQALYQAEPYPDSANRTNIAKLFYFASIFLQNKAPRGAGLCFKICKISL